MKNFTQKFIGLLALLFSTSISVNAQCDVGLDWDLMLLDSYGDGWNGATLSISNCNGDVLLDGSTRYRVFRLHKTGNANFTSATEEAFYAFPENNVPYS